MNPRTKPYNAKASIIEERSIEEDALSRSQEEEEEDDLNERLFDMYDQMFTSFNSFGSMFQQTAGLIG